MGWLSLLNGEANKKAVAEALKGWPEFRPDDRDRGSHEYRTRKNGTNEAYCPLYVSAPVSAEQFTILKEKANTLSRIKNLTMAADPVSRTFTMEKDSYKQLKELQVSALMPGY